jgi:hypothetical protein
VAELGAESAALLVVNVIVDLDDATELRLTVQLPEPPDVTAKGAHARAASEPGVNREIVELIEIPPSEAVKVPLEFDEKVPAVAVKATEEAPLGAVTVAADIFRRGLLLDTAIASEEPTGTAFVRLMVQAVEPPGVKELLAQTIEDGNAGGANERAVIATDPLRDAMRVIF